MGTFRDLTVDKIASLNIIAGQEQDKMANKDNPHIEFQNILQLISDARSRAFAKVNAELTLLYYNIGSIVSEKVAAGTWGEKTVDELAVFLQKKSPGLTGFNRRGLYRMKQFFETYSPASECYLLWLSHKLSPTAQSPSEEWNGTQIVSPLATQLQDVDNQHNKLVSAVPTLMHDSEGSHKQFVSTVLTRITWTNHLEIFSQAKSPEEKLFYLVHCIKEKWSMRDLRRQFASAYFERSVMGNKIVSALPTQLPAGIFKDPYVFEFLDLPEGHSENDLEKALEKNLRKFILEIGKGFTYMGNQFRLQVGNKDYYTDMLFFHRDLKCLVLFELKIQEFAPEFLGKLNFYLEALDRDVRRPDENPSVGILLCKGKDTEVVEYAMARNCSPAVIAEYETRLINKKLLAGKLRELSELL